MHILTAIISKTSLRIHLSTYADNMALSAFARRAAVRRAAID